MAGNPSVQNSSEDNAEALKQIQAWMRSMTSGSLKLVSIARSSDGYTPAAAVERLEASAIELFQTQYPSATVQYMYGEHH